MDVFEITGNRTGVARDGVNFLEPADSYQNLLNGYIYRQVLQSRMGFGFFATRLADNSRILGIFQYSTTVGEKELLAADENFLYRYNTVTGNFDQLAFGGSMAAYAGFNNTANDFYISGTLYPDKNNNSRFIICGQGITPNAAGSSIFFYDGTNVKDYTSVADNPDYAAPIEGPFTKATYVLYFGERINFVVPTINAIDYNQGMLYSGIRDSSGNGDKFNVAGAGILVLDTYDFITGAVINGQIISMNIEQGAYSIEKTTDAFNPYFSRRIPSVIGTTATFSSVAWDNSVKSIGKTGILGSDGRRSLRIDNKIPYFTQDDMDQLGFKLTYGGYDRVNNQFMWAYLESETGGDTQNKVLVYNYEESTWSIYDMRFSVLGGTDVGRNLPWEQIEAAAGDPSWAAWDTTEDLWDRIGVDDGVQKTLAGDDLGFIYELDKDSDDYFTTISGITQSAQAVLTVAATGLQAGDKVVVQDVAGMTQINNYDPEDQEANVNFVPYEIVSATPTSITLNVDSTLFTAYTSGGTISKIINFAAETIPFNPYRDQGLRCYISHVEFLLDTDNGYLKVDVYADEEETPFKRDILLYPDTSLKKRQWISMCVDNEANFHTFVMKQESPSSQIKITSIRIHAERGGPTSG